MSTASDQRSILPWWKLLALLTLCGAGTYLLLPDDAGFIERLLRDGQTREARRQLERVSPAARQAAPDRFRLLALQIARRELETSADPAAPLAFWRQAVAAWRESGFAPALFAEMQPAIARLRDPAPAWELVQPELPRLPPPQARRLTAEFVRAALAADQPATAAAAFAAGHPPAQRSVEDSLELARLWQLAGQPARALASFGDDQRPATAARRLELLRALNRNREALALLRARLADPAGGEPDPAAIAELATVAQQAGEPAAAVPYLRRLVERRPDDAGALRRLRDLLVATGDPAAAGDVAARAVVAGGQAPDDLRAHARILEWSGNPRAAFDVWLHPGLYRDADLARALERIVPVPGRPEYTLRLARLEVTLGRYDDALRHFDRHLADHGENADTLVELARIEMELNRFEAAEARFRRALQLRPGDAAIERDLAATLVWLGRNREALDLYGRLAAATPTEDILDAYTRLAESLGRYGELARALRQRIAHASPPAPRDFLLLAYAYELAGAPAERRAALEEGLRLAPASDELRLQLASALAAERKYVEAQAVLAPHRHLREEPLAAALYLELMRLNNDTAAERRFLAAPLTGALALDENVRERAALAYEALREFAPAEALRRSLLAERPDDPERIADLARTLLLARRPREARALLDPLLRQPAPAILQLAANVALAIGDYRAAEQYQLAYLAAAPAASAADWSALGDIRLSRGNRPGAKTAYATALRQMHGQLASARPPP